MDTYRAAALLSASLVGGCVADSRVSDHDTLPDDVAATTAAPLEPRSFPDPRREDDRTLRRCDDTPRPPCDGPFTGSACDLPCTPGVSAIACSLERTCHSDGRTYGLSARNALLYPASPEDPESVVATSFETWIVEHPEDIGLAAGSSTDHIELHPLGARSTAGPLTIFRFAQTYHGLPVLAPDGIVTLIYGPHGAVAFTGAIVDGRAHYDHDDAQASSDAAVRAMLVHASARSGIPVAELDVEHATPVAVPMRQAIGWAGFVRRKGGATVARVVVDADPVIDVTPLPLWSYDELVGADLGDTQPIEVQGLDVSGDLVAPGYQPHTSLTTGAPLLGSVDDFSLEIQLATERVVLLDLHGELEDELDIHATRVLDPTGEFLANAGSELGAQTSYHLFQSWYDLIDGHLTDPVTGTKRWDSANLLYTNGASPGDVPPGTYSPRVLAFTNANVANCPAGATACVHRSGYVANVGQAISFPELAHVPPGASKEETTATILLLGENTGPVTLAHELGHAVDLFTGGGLTRDFVHACGGTCAPECLEGTTDEAPALSESIAQLLTFVFLRHSFDRVDWSHCSIVGMISRNGDKAWTPGPCIPPEEDISLFQRPATCDKPAPYCDKPDAPGFEPQCCFDDEDLTECTLVVPTQCPVGAAGPSGGVGTGTARAIPTGLCAPTGGYGTNSLFQAFWQLLHGQRCDPTPPFACVSAAWAPGVDPMVATSDALLHALRTNPLTYDQLVEAMATYVSCTYGPAAHAELNAVLCNHGIRDCAAPAPMICETCGNGVREGNETCDGDDWLHASCDELPQYSGGTLACDPVTCTLDESQCAMPGLDTTAGTMTPDESTTTVRSGDTGTDTDTGLADPRSNGCDCRVPATDDGRPPLLLFMLVAAKRRRSST